MGFTIDGRASLSARNAITVRESGFRGNTLIAAISEERASASEDVGTNGTGISTRAMTSEDDWGLRGGLSGRQGSDDGRASGAS
jgi:hypothetical protein